MTLQTSRLLLSSISAEDVKEVHELLSLAETDRYNTLGIPGNIGVTQKIVHDWLATQNASAPTNYVFRLDLIYIEEFIGLIALNMGKPSYKTAEVWFKTHPAQWSKGYTTEALRKILEFGFNELGLHRIEAGCAVENTASAKVLEKAGMTREGLKRKKLPIRGEWKDNFFYGILEEDFFSL